MKLKILFLLILVFSLLPQSAHAFQYPALPSGNLIQNAWFRNSTQFPNCSWTMTGWQTTSLSVPTSDPNWGPPWGHSEKSQDPNDINCIEGDSNYWGYAARFAENTVPGQSFFPGDNARIWQVIKNVDPNMRTLHFHSLIVAHRVNQYKAEIYGSNSENGPWTLVWTPFNILNCLSLDCVNNTYGAASNQGDRTGLWADVTADVIQLNEDNIIDPNGPLEPVKFNISQGFSNYKIEFLINYPEPNLNLATGDVGGKLARVYFKVSGSGGPTQPPATPTPARTPTPTLTLTPTPTPSSLPSLKQMLISWLTSMFDQNGDGEVNSMDFALLVPFYDQPSTLVAGSGISYRDTLPTAEELKIMADEVVSDVNASLSGTSPTLVLVYTNAGMDINVSGNTQNVGQYIKNQLNPMARLAGEGTGADKYPTLTNNYFPAPNKRALSVLALAGTSLEHIEMVTEQTTNSNGRNAAEYLADSQSIGSQLGNRILANIPDYQSKSNLLLITGPYHGDINVVEVKNGLTQGLTSAGVNTNFIKFLGAGGTDNAGSSFNDTWQGGRSLTGVLISGSFGLALSGRAGFDNCPGGPVLTSSTQLTNLKTELGGAPKALIYIPGHPNTQLCSYPDTQSVMSAMQATTSQVFGTNVAAIGTVGGSEIGHYTTTGTPVGDVFQFFVAGLK